MKVFETDKSGKTAILELERGDKIIKSKTRP